MLPRDGNGLTVIVISDNGDFLFPVENSIKLENLISLSRVGEFFFLAKIDYRADVGLRSHSPDTAVVGQKLTGGGAVGDGYLQILGDLALFVENGKIDGLAGVVMAIEADTHSRRPLEAAGSGSALSLAFGSGFGAFFEDAKNFAKLHDLLTSLSCRQKVPIHLPASPCTVCNRFSN